MPRGPMIRPRSPDNVRRTPGMSPDAPKEVHRMLSQDVAEARRYFADKIALTTGPFEVDGMLSRGEPITILDVRLPSDYKHSHIPGAINLPKGKWHTLQGLRKDRTTVVYCYNPTCKLAAEAAVELAWHGYPVIEMEGGFTTWEAYKLPVERSR